MKTILVLHTGGTISMAQEADGKVAPTEENPLVQQKGWLQDRVNLQVEELFNLPSPHITLAHMLCLQQRIRKAHEEAIDGVVITHGTDTLEETAYFLDLTVEPKIPVVVTGAMRSSNEIGTDGLHNFATAVYTACAPASQGKGVLVVMNDEIHAARYVTKTHTTNVATFRTPTFGPIGMLVKERAVYASTVVPQEVCPVQTVAGNVYILTAHAGMDGSLLAQLAIGQTQGIVIEALGAGNLPPQVLPVLEKLLAAAIPVVLVSRCANGIAEDIYGYEGGGAKLKEMGVIFARGLNGQKARIRLIVGLNSGKVGAELRRYLSVAFEE